MTIQRNKFSLDSLVNTMLDNLPNSVWEDPTQVFVDPAMAGGQFVLEIEERLRDAGHSDENIASRVFGYNATETEMNYAVRMNDLVGNYTAADFTTLSLENMTHLKDAIVVTNPPYQPPTGVKKGGGYYLKFIEKALELDPAHMLMVVPFTWQVRQDSGNVRTSLRDAGLKLIKHCNPKTFDNSILANFFHTERGYTGPVTQEAYQVTDTEVYTRTEMTVSEDIIPVVRDEKELELFNHIWENKDTKVNVVYGANVTEDMVGVEYSYLIGMEKEKMNIATPMRKHMVKKAGEAISNDKNRFIPTKDLATAEKLNEFLATVGQEFFRTIPRGSSLENWMVAPVVATFYQDGYDK